MASWAIAPLTLHPARCRRGQATNWQAVAAGWYHTVALKGDGTLWGWGDNRYGRLGNGDMQITPGKIGLPAIVTQPQGQRALAGARVSLSVTATGSKHLSYQWQQNGTNLTDSARINGSQYASLNLFTLQAGDTGNYQVVITNAYGSVTSAIAVVAVAAPAAPTMGGVVLTNGTFTAMFMNTPGATFTALGTTNLTLRLSDWEVVGSVVEVAPGQFQLTGPQISNSPCRFYRLRCP